MQPLVGGALDVAGRAEEMVRGVDVKAMLGLAAQGVATAHQVERFVRQDAQGVGV